MRKVKARRRKVSTYRRYKAQYGERVKFRGKGGQFTKPDGRKKITIEILDEPPPRIKGRFVSVLPPEKIPPKVIPPEELSFCVPDLPDDVLQRWQNSAGFEFFDSLNNIYRREQKQGKELKYPMYFMCRCEEWLYQDKIIEHRVEDIPGAKHTILHFQKICQEMKEFVLRMLTDRVGGKGWEVEYVFAKDESLPRLSDEKYKIRWTKEAKAKAKKTRRRRMEG